ncbi:MAG: PAS domain-containing sensor histidine kinase, partial [Chlorobi bacterium]|nr:PAS domain-containing sensor histidine kinase [Chlorobiota bacterium]
SPSCFQITGYTPEEFLNDPDLLVKIIVPQERKLYKEHLKKHKTGKHPGKMQFKISKKNGDMRIIRHTCQGVFDKNGKYIGRRVTNRNATDRFIEEQKAIQAERKYHEIFNSLLDVYYQVDENSIITLISPSVKILAGYEPEELVGKHASAFYPNYEEYERIREILIANKGGSNIELKLLRKDGELRTASLNTNIIIDANGEVKGFQGILRDITKLKKIQKELEAAKNEAQKYLSIAQTMIVVIDEKNYVTLINQKGCEILGYREEEVIGKNWITSFLRGETRKQTAAYFDKLSKGKIEFPSETENEIETRSGKKRLIKWYNTILWDDNNNFVGILSAGVDVTDERKMLLQIRQSESELKELNAAKDKFFSIISHDLRSPFTSLLGYTQLATEEFDELEKEDLKFYVDAIRRISVKIFELIKELLEWSYVQTGRIQIELKKLLIKNCVIPAIELHADALKNKSIKIENLVDEKITALADESALHTVLRNLLGNAIKFTPAGGKITIESKILDDNVLISVSDTGVGIDAGDLKKLFIIGENFTRNGTDGEQGTGLGLILCKELVAKMNGEIWAESKTNFGSVFFIKLPQKK